MNISTYTHHNITRVCDTLLAVFALGCIYKQEAVKYANPRYLDGIEFNQDFNRLKPEAF